MLDLRMEQIMKISKEECETLVEWIHDYPPGVDTRHWGWGILDNTVSANYLDLPYLMQVKFG